MLSLPTTPGWSLLCRVALLFDSLLQALGVIPHPPRLLAHSLVTRRSPRRWCRPPARSAPRWKHAHGSSRRRDAPAVNTACSQLKGAPIYREVVAQRAHLLFSCPSLPRPHGGCCALPALSPPLPFRKNQRAGDVSLKQRSVKRAGHKTT